MMLAGVKQADSSGGDDLMAVGASSKVPASSPVMGTTNRGSTAPSCPKCRGIPTK